jgi:alkanesulfonate monooxygenase SsuD/methylene tetrahydromethanopterin reductase-like flavin-dependent oxidoreductase (luciferase family)
MGRVSLDQLRDASRRIDEAAMAAGRDPSEVRRIYNIGGVITDGPGEGVLVGPPQRWIDTLVGWATDPGIDTFIFWPTADELAQVERFASEVVPLVRERLATS